MITAYASVALDAAAQAGEQHARDLSTFEKVILSGEGETWAQARGAIVVPDGAVVLAYAHWPLA